MATITVQKHISWKTFLVFVGVMVFFFIQTLTTVNFSNPNYTGIIIKLCVYMGIGTVLSFLSGSTDMIMKIIRILHDPTLSEAEKTAQIEKIVISAIEAKTFGGSSSDKSSNSTASDSTPRNTYYLIKRIEIDE